MSRSNYSSENETPGDSVQSEQKEMNELEHLDAVENMNYYSSFSIFGQQNNSLFNEQQIT